MLEMSLLFVCLYKCYTPNRSKQQGEYIEVTLNLVFEVNDYFHKTIITTVITCQYTVQNVVTNRKLQCRTYLENQFIPSH